MWFGGNNLHQIKTSAQKNSTAIRNALQPDVEKEKCLISAQGNRGMALKQSSSKSNKRQSK